MSNQPPPEDRPTGPVSGVHPEIDELSAYAAGDLAEDDATRVAGHVAGCAECTGDVAALRAAVADLHALPAVTMPADVADRLADAVRRERAAADAIPAPGAVSSSGGAGRLRRRATPWPGIAAGLAAVALGGAVVAGALSGGADDSADTTAGSAKSEQTAAAATSAAAEDGGPAPAAGSPAPAATAAASPSDTTTTAIRATGTDYHRDTARFTGEVRAALATPPAVDIAEPLSAASPFSAEERTALGELRSGGDAVAAELRPFTQDAKRVAQCVAVLTGGDPVDLVSIDLARFVGRPAAVFVFAGAEPSTYAVYVVRPDCGASETAPDPQLHYEVVTAG
ncbi:MAG TPA: zf-HC2 domain-containing protein [Mycobacteriales bacterium]|jgi:hypothetical protein|nr:zf-HC2 domain-containing protein [Mycobacteriales bacterium]